MKKNLTSACLASAVALNVASLAAAAPKWAKHGGKNVVKCRGVAKQGHNDCGANGHDCAGKAAKDNDPNEWIYLPEGVCEKIPGGVVWKTEKVK